MHTLFFKIRFSALYAAAMAIVLLLLCPVSSAQSIPETKTVLAIGDSRIYRELSSAKQAAIEEALFFAVQSTATERFSEDEIDSDFEIIGELLVSRQDEFIQNYAVMQEQRTEKHYRVLLRATVRVDSILQELVDAGFGKAPDQLPSVVLMVAEKHLYDMNYQYWWKSGFPLFSANTATRSISGILGEKGFVVVDPQNAGSLNNEGNDNQDGNRLEPGSTPSNYEAAQFGKRLEADLVIVGTAEIVPSNRVEQNKRTFKGVIDVRVLRTDTGEELTAIRQSAVAAAEKADRAAENALSDAAGQVSAQLANNIPSLWKKTEADSDTISLVVTGKSILPYLEKFRRSVSAIRGVQTLKTMQMTPDSANLSVQFDGTSGELADLLPTQPYERFGVNIMGTSPDSITVEIVSR